VKTYRNNAKKYTVSILGLGYVGLPLAVLCAYKGHKTFALDVDGEKVRLLQEGKFYIADEIVEKYSQAARSKDFYPSTDFSKINESVAIHTTARYSSMRAIGPCFISPAA